MFLKDPLVVTNIGSHSMTVMNVREKARMKKNKSRRSRIKDPVETLFSKGTKKAIELSPL